MASGRARQRKRFQSVPTVMGASWKLNKVQAQLLEWFVTDLTNDAVNWFVMPVLTPQGLIEHEVRFINSPLESCTYNGGFWIYSANIEIKKRIVPTQEQAVSQALKPDTLNNYVRDFKTVLNKYQETSNE